MGIAVNVILEADPTDDELAAVKAGFREAGFDARVSSDPWAKGAGGDFPWMVIISVPVGLFIKALAEEAGKDAYKHLKRLVKKLYDARKASQFTHGSVIVQDTDTSASATLPPELSEEAWQAVAEVSFEGLPGATYRWNSETGEWQELRWS